MWLLSIRLFVRCFMLEIQVSSVLPSYSVSLQNHMVQRSNGCSSHYAKIPAT